MRSCFCLLVSLRRRKCAPRCGCCRHLGSREVLLDGRGSLRKDRCQLFRDELETPQGVPKCLSWARPHLEWTGELLYLVPCLRMLRLCMNSLQDLVEFQTFKRLDLKNELKTCKPKYIVIRQQSSRAIRRTSISEHLFCCSFSRTEAYQRISPSAQKFSLQDACHKTGRDK